MLFLKELGNFFSHSNNIYALIVNICCHVRGHEIESNSVVRCGLLILMLVESEFFVGTTLRYVLPRITFDYNELGGF